MKEIWIGFHRDLSRLSKILKKMPDRMVSQPHDLLGYQGPLTIRLYGRYKQLPDWVAIRQQLHRMKISNPEIQVDLI